MILEKCKYYNDHQTACSLMIDDLVPAAVSANGIIGPHNDWGYLMDGEGSLYKYFESMLLAKYPEIKGTIFFPLESAKYISKNNGFEIFTSNIDEKYLEFINRISYRFEFAFHGVKHVWKNIHDETTFEFRDIDNDSKAKITQTLKAFQKETGIQFSGGKFPGYWYNQIALDFIKELNFKWWALDFDMLNKSSIKNALLWNDELQIVVMPSNVTGDIYKNYYWRNSARRIIGRLLKPFKLSHPIDFLKYLYDNGLPIIIQEHFQNQTPNGTRQSINVYDDIWSLDNIYGLLRGLDIWHAKCGEIAEYFSAFHHSEIIEIDSDQFRLIYKNKYNPTLISIKSKSRKIINRDDGNEFFGIAKKDHWVFNKIPAGTYKLR